MLYNIIRTGVTILFEIEYYTENNKCPVYEFIKSQIPKDQAKILKEIDLLAEFGLSLGMPYIKRRCKAQIIFGN